MSLIAPLLLFVALVPRALAGGTAIWLAGPSQPALVPDMALLDAESAAPAAPWTDRDSKTVAALGEELVAVQGLIDVFDGELQIMRRLQSAIEDLRTIRSEDREPIYRALVLQGYAVWRYFPDNLATDPAAATYRTAMGDLVMNRPWADAIALDPDRQPSPADLPDEAARAAFIEARAQLMLAAPASVLAEGLPRGASLWVDGVAATTNVARVPPGMHWAAVVSGDTTVVRTSARVAAGEVWPIPVPATEAELRALGHQLLLGPSTVALTPQLQATLASLKTPAVLAVTDRRRSLVYDVVSDTAQLRTEAAAQGTDQARSMIRLGAGSAWVYDGDFYVQNVGAGAPHEAATVNAFTPQLAVSGELRAGPMSLGAGIDLAVPIGEYHTLPVGEHTFRLRAYPHLAAGLPVAQVTVGAWLPWRIGVGAKVHLPLWGPLQLSGSYLYGVGLPISRGEGLADFEPATAQTAGIGVDVALGG